VDKFPALFLERCISLSSLFSFTSTASLSFMAQDLHKIAAELLRFTGRKNMFLQILISAALGMGLMASKTAIAVESNGVRSGVNEATDNSAFNKTFQEPGELTADQQGSDEKDIELTREIRKAIVSDENLSLYAHNVKIISRNGLVTLEGPVHSQAEVSTIQRIAGHVAGATHVRNKLKIQSGE
jgi:hyperosmotically inducible periplasmic protein